MKLKIITQERVVFDEEVDEIYSKGVRFPFIRFSEDKHKTLLLKESSNERE